MLDTGGAGVPRVIHWGADLGDTPESALVALAASRPRGVPPSSIDEPFSFTLLPLPSDGWGGQPGLTGLRAGVTATPTFMLTVTREPAPGEVVFALDDSPSGLSLTLAARLSRQGLLHLVSTLTNTGDTDFTLTSLRHTLPLPDTAREVLDFSGRWSHERRPQRRLLEHGTWSRQLRHGRTGHDAPLLLAAGTPGFGFRHGQVWGIHFAFSGDQEWSAEYQATGHALLAAGELLQPGEVVLAPGESYTTPELVAAHGTDGLDTVSQRFHSESRERFPLSPRPVIMNTWEAVYFDHRLDRLTELAELGASVGVERFVLDDGWMTGRTDAKRALGDWSVDPVRWPEGLHPLISRVHELGMEFGLWIEPEMVSLDSDLAAKHPEWVLRDASGRLPMTWRDQYALDLANPDAYANILGQLVALLDEYPIAYFKWDQNRDLLGGSSHAQTLAAYRLMDALKEHQPGLEIESCSSGGARVDLGVEGRTDRVWASDTNDPFERQGIQRHTSLVMRPEVIGSHLGAEISHTTGRVTELGFRLATALFWSAGIEWDLTLASPDELAAVTRWIDVYKAERALLHSGTVVRVDDTDPAVHVHGVVATDLSQAIFAIVVDGTPRDSRPGWVRFPGLDAHRDYAVEVVDLGAAPKDIQDIRPAWLGTDARGMPGLRLSGRMLAEAGLPTPLLHAGNAVVVKFTA